MDEENEQFTSALQRPRERPRIPLGEKSERAKRLAGDLLTHHTPEKLMYAQRSQRRPGSEGRKGLAYVLAHSGKTPKSQKGRRMIVPCSDRYNYECLRNSETMRGA